MRRYKYQIRPWKIIGILLLVIAAILIFGNITMLLWNGLMPVIFHLPVITFWQALGLILLSKILFGGFRGGRGPGRHMKNRMQEKWMTMSPEEKEKFKQDWRNRCRGRSFRDRGTDPFEELDKKTGEEKSDL